MQRLSTTIGTIAESNVKLIDPRKFLLQAVISSFKKALLALAVFSFFCPALPFYSSAQAKEPIPADLNLFEDKEKGYNILLPRAWKVKSDSFVDVVAAPGEAVNGVNPIPNVKVVVKPIPTGHTLDTICDTAVRQWSAIWKVESDKKSDAGEVPTRKLILVQSLKLPVDSSQPVTQQTKILKAFAVSKENYFIISCSNYVDDFEKTQTMFNKIVDSLTLTKP